MIGAVLRAFKEDETGNGALDKSSVFMQCSPMTHGKVSGKVDSRLENYLLLVGA
jgi:hypothetical protein